MYKQRFFMSLLTGLIISCSIMFINPHKSVITVNHLENLDFSSKYKIRTGYTFIWEEYDNAPGDQQGDDSVVFGPSFGPYHNYSELVTKLQNLNTSYPEVIHLFTIGKTYFGIEIYCVRITNESISIPKTEVLIVGYGTSIT